MSFGSAEGERTVRADAPIVACLTSSYQASHARKSVRKTRMRRHPSKSKNEVR